MTNGPTSRRPRSVALISTYVPRQCGIATFCKDLYDAIAGELENGRCLVVALDDREEGYRYPDEVRFVLLAERPREYANAADLININQVDVALVQHEFGIFGGPDGAHVIDLLEGLSMSALTTLHTVLPNPTEAQKRVMKEVARLSDRLVVMAPAAIDILESVYAVPREKVCMIPHGIPDVPFIDPAFYKDQFGLEGRRVLLTFGLLSPGKGIEVAIEAMPRIVQHYPDAAYVILGTTHPVLLRKEGNAYRDSLERLVEKHDLRDHVAFHNRFVSLEELIGYLGAADVYLTPYPGKDQITSGTLAYAAGAGKAIVSTPYLYAEYLLGEGRGMLFPFNDSQALADRVIELFDNDVERHAMRKRAYQFCRPMVWREVARSYLDLADQVIRERTSRPRSVMFSATSATRRAGVPEPNVDHLLRLSDDTGVLHHAKRILPERRHGYHTADQALALEASILAAQQGGDPRAVRIAHRCLTFIDDALCPETARFRAHLHYNREWDETTVDERTLGLIAAALGRATALAGPMILPVATRLSEVAFEHSEALTDPTGCALSLIGLHTYMSRFSGDALARRVRATLAERLYAGFVEQSNDDWPWPTNVVDRESAHLPHALILCGQWLPHGEMLDRGLASLDWLWQQQHDGKRLQLIGSEGGLGRDGGRAAFDQLPIDAMALAQACVEAYHATNQTRWRDRARLVVNWFLGSNAAGAALYDYATKGCCDGLHADGVNHNQGPVATAAWLITLITVGSLDTSRVTSTPVETSAERSAVSAC